MVEAAETYKEKIALKSKVIFRRKQKFSPSGQNGVKRKHWANHAGTYRTETILEDETLETYTVVAGPKFWKGNKPVILSPNIRGHKSLVTALSHIESGITNQDHYENVSGLNRERLRIAQSLRDRRISFDVREIARAGYEELRRYKKPA